MNRKRMKWLALALTAALGMSTASGCYWVVSEVVRESNKVVLEIEQEPQLFSVYNETDGRYDARVEGLVKNDTEAKISISINVVLYDADGNVIGAAYDYIDSVSGGETWRFCATSQTSFEAVSYRIESLEGVKCIIDIL